MVKETYNRDYWKFWRLYKTRRGARAYAKKHSGGWVVIKMNPDLLTAKEKKHGLGTWLVGSTTEYLYYKARHSKIMDFEANYEAVEMWEDGELLAVFDEDDA
jgi:hypothetical protein